MNGTIRYWNHGAELLYGFTAAEAIGRYTHNLLKTQFLTPFDTVMLQLDRDGVWTGDLMQTCRDGTTITVVSRWVLQRGQPGNPAIILESKRRRLTESCQCFVNLVRRDDQRRDPAHGVVVCTTRKQQHAFVFSGMNHILDELFGFVCASLYNELGTDHQAFAAHVANLRIFLLELAQTGH